MDLTAVLVVGIIFYTFYALWSRSATKRERLNFFDLLSTMDPAALQAYKEINPNGRSW